MDSKRESYATLLWEERKRNGITLIDANKMMRERNYFASMMVKQGDADALVTGYSRSYPTVVKPILEMMDKAPGVQKIATANMMLTERGPLFLADTAINPDPTAEEVAHIAYMTDKTMRMFGVNPAIALVSYSNFGSSHTPSSKKMNKAVKMLHQMYPEMIVDGEIQADFALNPDMLKSKFPFSKLVDQKVNALVFSNLDAANITYKHMKELNKSTSIGPIIMGLEQPVHIFQLGARVDEMVNMAAVAVVDAQEKAKKNKLIKK